MSNHLGNTMHFEKRSTMKTTAEELMAFHEQPHAFSILTPPPIIMRVHRDDKTSIREGEVEFTLWFGPIPLRWLSRHEPGLTELSFIDNLLQGPVDHWRHEHIFQPVNDGAELIDRLNIQHKAGWRGIFTRLMFNPLSLHILFFYRHYRTKRAVER